MIDILFDFYKKELSLKKMIFSKMKFWYYSSVIAPVIFPAAAFYITYLLDKKFSISSHIVSDIVLGDIVLGDIVLGIIAILIICLLTACLMCIVTAKAKEETCSKYKIESDSRFYWYSNKVNHAIMKESKEKLLNKLKEQRDFISSDYIKRQIEMAQKRADTMKYEFPIKIATSILFIIPIWNKFIDFLFNSCTNKIEFFIIISIIFLGMFLLQYARNIIILEFFNRDYNRMKELEELLYELYFDIEESKQTINYEL